MSVSISGTVYTDRGVTTMASGRTLNITINGGASAGNTTTAANGTYTISGLTIVAADKVGVYLQGNTELAVTGTIATGANQSGFDLYQNYLIARSDNGGSLTCADLGTIRTNAATGLTGIISAASATSFNTASGKAFYIPAGQSFTFGTGTCTLNAAILYCDGTFVTTSGTVVLTRGSGTCPLKTNGSALANLTLSAILTYTVQLQDALTVAGTLTVAAGETLDANSKTITFSSFGSGFSVAGTVSNLAAVALTGTSFTSGGVSIPTLTVATVGTCALSSALTVTTALIINSGATLSLAGSNLTAAGATFANSGTLSLRGSETLTGFTNDTANGGTVTYVGTGTVSYAGLVAGNSYRHLTFNGSGRTWLLTSDVTITGNLTRTAGRFLDGGLTVNVGGNWVNTAGVGAFVLTGTTTFTGTAQTISGTTTFSTLVMTTGGDVVTFTDGTTTTVDTAFTAQNVTLQGSSTGGWTIAVPAAQTIDHVTVSYSTATGNTAAAGPTSTDGGNNVNWTFGSPPPSSVVNQQLPLLMGQ